MESMRSGGAIPPLRRGISAMLARYPMKTRQMCAIPPSAILSRKGIARYGGVSRTGPLSMNITQGKTKEQTTKGQNRFIIFHIFTLFGTFSEFFPQDFPLENKGF